MDGSSNLVTMLEYVDYCNLRITKPLLAKQSRIRRINPPTEPDNICLLFAAINISQSISFILIVGSIFDICKLRYLDSGGNWVKLNTFGCFDLKNSSTFLSSVAT